MAIACNGLSLIGSTTASVKAAVVSGCCGLQHTLQCRALCYITSLCHKIKMLVLCSVNVNTSDVNNFIINLPIVRRTVVRNSQLTLNVACLVFGVAV